MHRLINSVEARHAVNWCIVALSLSHTSHITKKLLGMFHFPRDRCLLRVALARAVPGQSSSQRPIKGSLEEKG